MLNGSNNQRQYETQSGCRVWRAGRSKAAIGLYSLRGSKLPSSADNPSVDIRALQEATKWQRAIERSQAVPPAHQPCLRSDEGMSSSFFRSRSLKTRVTLFTIGILLLGIWALAFYASRMLRQDMQRALGQQQLSTVAIMATDVNQQLDERLRALEKVIERVNPALLGSAAAMQAFLDDRPILQSLFNGGVIAYRVDGTAIADSLSGAGRIGVNYMDIDTVATALKEGKSSIGKPVMGKKLGAPVFGATAPIRDSQGRVVGALSGVVNLGRPSFLDKITQNRYGSTGGYLVVSKQHRVIIAATDQRRIMEPLPAPGAFPVIERFVGGYEGTEIWVNPLGQEVLQSAKGIAVADWYLAAALPTAEAFAPIYDMQQRLLLATLLLTLLAAALLRWILARQLAPMLATVKTLATLGNEAQPVPPLPIARKDEIGDLIGGFNRLLETLAQREDALKKSEQNLAITLNSIGDAVIATDTTGRITGMNPMAERMCGWALTEAMGRPLTTVFCIVNGATRESVADPVQLVMAQGQVVGLANHTVLVARDGQQYQIADSAAPVRSAGGEITGVVLVFSDVTEKYRNESALRDSEERWKLALESTGDGMWDWHIQTDEQFFSKRLTEMYGYGEDETLDPVDGPDSRTHPDDRAQLQSDRQAHFKNLAPIFINERRLRCKDGSWKWVLSRGMVISRDEQGRPLRMIGTHTDITNRKLAEQFEQFRRHTLELLAGDVPLPEILEAIVLGVEKLHPATFCSILLLDKEGRHLVKGVAPSLPDFYNEALHGVEIGLGVGSCGTAAFTGERVIVEDIAAHPYWTLYKELAARAGVGSCWSQPIRSSSGQVLGTFAIYHHAAHTPNETDLRDIEQAGQLASIAIERKQAQAKLQLAADVFTHAREGIIVTETDGTIIDVNEAFTRITGYSQTEVVGQTPRVLSSGLQDKAFYESMWLALIEQGHWYGETWNRRKNGEVFAMMQTISAVRDAGGATQQYVSLFSDITSLKAHQSQLEHIAHFDVLTNLPNRVLLADRLHQAMAQAQRRGQHLAVAYLDLDGFKAINDQHGHATGDQVLITLAQRMKLALREADSLARLGGDEFVAVLIDLADMSACLPLLTRLLSAAAQPVQVGELTLQVSASLGVTLYPQSQDIDADQLLRQADQAMYQAKLAGKNRYQIFDAEQDSSIRGHHESLERIRLALEQREFVLYYQPKVNMRTGEVIGAEALIRWQHPEKGLLAPAVFLPVIESHPLAAAIGEWVIETALTQMELWCAVGLDLPVSVNIGARQLQQSDFVDQLRAVLQTHPQVSPGRLELEVLETSALEDIGQVSQVIEACAQMGVTFALDDFGTGYSSLTYLRRLRVAMLKIDKSFVRDMLDDPDDLAILKGVIGLAAAFKRQVIAEGVETAAHGTLLLELGCDLAQGYGIARPMPAEQFPAWVANWQPDTAWSALPWLGGLS